GGERGGAGSERRGGRGGGRCRRASGGSGWFRGGRRWLATSRAGPPPPAGSGPAPRGACGAPVPDDGRGRWGGRSWEWSLTTLGAHHNAIDEPGRKGEAIL